MKNESSNVENGIFLSDYEKKLPLHSKARYVMLQIMYHLQIHSQGTP